MNLEVFKRNKRLFITIGSIFAFLLLAGFAYYLLFVNTAKVSAHPAELSVTKPIEINFNKKVSHEAVVNLSPAADYHIEWSDSLVTSKVLLVPTSRWLTGTEYSLRLSDVKTVLNQTVPELDYSFTTQTAPNIAEITPAPQAVNVAINPTITLRLDSPNENLLAPIITFTPEAKFETNLAADKMSYTLKFTENLQQSTTYKLNIVDKYRKNGDSSLQVYESTFSTVPKVGVTGFTPNGNMNLKNSTVKVTFVDDMDKATTESSFSISPAAPGTFSWPDARTLIYNPAGPLVLNTAYSVKLTTGAKNNFGGILEADFTSAFSTIGYVSASMTPSWNKTEVDLNTAIRVYFNQEVVRSSAESNFSLTPNTAGNFSWSGNTMTFNPTGQAYLTRYTVNEQAGVKSVNGLDSAQAYGTTYTTVTPVKTLNVPYYRQNYYLSCEAAALKMALAFKGVNVSEDNIFSVMGYDYPGAKTADNVWGNPNRGFVGNVMGNGTTTGYGVNWGPIARAANNFRTSSAFSGGSAQTLTTAIDNGNPVIIWGTIGNPYSMSWTDYSTGEAVSAVKGEHARVVKGYRGFASNPIGFYINDPIYGNIYWDTGTLLGNWGWFNNSGVIVY
jgi:uncharacterized protein YvpB